MRLVTRVCGALPGSGIVMAVIGVARIVGLHAAHGLRGGVPPATASSSSSPLQWGYPPSPHTPRRREDGEHDGAKESAWRGSSASAVAGVVGLANASAVQIWTSSVLLQQQENGL